MAEARERTKRGFAWEQAEYLQELIAAASRGGQSFDGPTQIWLLGGISALEIAANGILYSEIRANRNAISANRDAIAELSMGQARIGAILEERLPRRE